MLTLVAISLDRFYVILYPFNSKLKIRHCLWIIAFIWLMSFLLSSYNLLNYDLTPVYDELNHSIIKYQCVYIQEDIFRFQLLILTIVQFLIPLIIISFTLLTIYLRIYHDSQMIDLGVHSNQIKNKKKVEKFFKSKNNHLWSNYFEF